MMINPPEIIKPPMVVNTLMMITPPEMIKPPMVTTPPIMMAKGSTARALG